MLQQFVERVRGGVPPDEPAGGVAGGDRPCPVLHLCASGGGGPRPPLAAAAAAAVSVPEPVAARAPAAPSAEDADE